VVLVLWAQMQAQLREETAAQELQVLFRVRQRFMQAAAAGVLAVVAHRVLVAQAAAELVLHLVLVQQVRRIPVVVVVAQ
jgi:hypothetical protein